ncbi:hypothetical protein SELMODRAFT_414557 [Selaginella moellendorffii]|uniref:Uncharacterized protein n=1 Tax=Selaginella moellendorffii TaxID=88036 RepID=D8RT59_SELML|nr:hypothetical protein SELMODRAFT_414557 [Selaginella moellendorffii]
MTAKFHEHSRSREKINNALVAISCPVHFYGAVTTPSSSNPASLQADRTLLKVTWSMDLDRAKQLHCFSDLVRIPLKKCSRGGEPSIEAHQCSGEERIWLHSSGNYIIVDDPAELKPVERCARVDGGRERDLVGSGELSLPNSWT